VRRWLTAVLLVSLLAAATAIAQERTPAQLGDADQTTDTDGDGWSDVEDHCVTVPFSTPPGWLTNAESFLHGCPLERTPPFPRATAQTPLLDAARAFVRAWRDPARRRDALRTGRLGVPFRIPERTSGHGRIRAGLHLVAPAGNRSKGGEIIPINGVRWCKPATRRCVVHASVRPEDLRMVTADKGTVQMDFTVTFKLAGSDTKWRMWTTRVSRSVRL
jgi:hypothetical protein